MICYRLRCDAGHEFEGWYRDSATFAQLQASGFLSCPECGNADVRQALMAPAIARQSRTPPPERDPERDAERQAGTQVGTRDETPVGPDLPDQMRAALQKLRQAVETGCENVGNRFAEEALRIHHKEAPERGIYGQASEEERAMLVEEGVSMLTIPWVRRADG